jgi:hypothetical protein
MLYAASHVRRKGHLQGRFACYIPISAAYVQLAFQDVVRNSASKVVSFSYQSRDRLVNHNDRLTVNVHRDTQLGFGSRSETLDGAEQA